MLNPKRTSLLLAGTLVASLLVVIATTLSRGQTTPSTNPSIAVLRHKGQRNLPPTAAEIASRKGQLPKEERQLEDKLPKHLPIKVKLRAEQEKAFKDLANEHWARDFELEVQNTGTKPIYRLGLLLLLPETQIDGGRLLFSLHYGRTELSVFKERLELAKPEDVPIEPGKTYIFKIPAGQVEGWEDSVKTEGWPQPKKIVLRFEQLSFGDGTGFRWGEGVPWPQPGKKTWLVHVSRVQTLALEERRPPTLDGQKRLTVADGSFH